MKSRGKKEVMMSDIDLTSMIFPVNRRTTGWLIKLKKALYKMRTNVESFSLLVFVNAGSEGATLTLPAPWTDSLSGCILEASRPRAALSNDSLSQSPLKASRTAPRIDPLFGSLFDASLARPASHSLLQAPSPDSHSSSPMPDSCLFKTDANLLDADSFLLTELVCLSSACSVSWLVLSPFADNPS